jgi:imidazolonepropionase
MMRVDLLIHSAAQVVTCASPDGPKRGRDMADVGLIEDGAVAVQGESVVAVGPSAELRALYTGEHEIDASGQVVCPGFVDPHTHAVYAGDRVGEFESRIRGKTYLQIMAEGGGIVSTMRAVRTAPLTHLIHASRERLDAMLALGTTTAEIKTGYGLDAESELKMLDAIAALDASHALDLVPTFMAAHAIPPEFTGRPDEYIAEIIESMLPAARDWYAASAFRTAGVPCFVDVFCEVNAFDVAQSRRVLQTGRDLGFGVKAHVDEFNALGGVTLGLESGALSLDHLDVTRPDEAALLAASNTAAVIMPAVNFNLGSTHFADARALIDAGGIVALATDINPGSAPCPSMPLIMAIACRYQRLLPSEALTASTINAAYAIGMSDRVGSLETGKQADLLIVGAPDYRHLAYQFGGNLVRRVIKRGVPVI